MDVVQQGILTLLRSGLTSEVLPLPGEFDFSQAYPGVCEHQVHTLAYKGALHCGVSKDLLEMKLLFQRYCQCIMHSERQIRAVDAVFQAFDENGIEHLTVKGYHLKKLYPAPELRLMGDADVLIHAAEYQKVSALLEQMGYREQAEGENDNAWVSADLFLEIHRELISASNPEFYRYFGDGWKLAKPVSGNHYALSLEDEYLYLVAHLAKHYRNSGIGLRHVVDLWVYRRAYPDMDEKYINRGLREMHLVDFHANLLRMLRAWFEDAGFDDVTDFMTEVIFNSGAWGERLTSVISASLRNKQATGSMAMGKIKQVWTAVFLPYRIMWQKYPILKKWPVLLPLFWPVRWVTTLLYRRENLRQWYREMHLGNEEEIFLRRQALNYVGLDFHFD